MADPQEFRRYRQGLALLFAAVGGLGSVLLIVSIAVALFGRHPRKVEVGSPTDLLACNHDVRGLLEDLAKTAAQLQLDAVTGDSTNQADRWDKFSEDWQLRWDEVGARCSFDALADNNAGPAFERMATVHRQLPVLKLEYREMMERWSENQAKEIAEMRQALDRSEADLRRSTPH